MKIAERTKKILVALPAILSLVLMFQGCKLDDAPNNIYTFKEQLIGQYLDANPAEFSEFDKMLDTAGVKGLLNAYGLYTCFIPTNAAIRAYYAKEGKSQMSDFTLDEIKTFCYNHIIKGDTIKTADFSAGTLSTLSMSGRFISINYADTTSTIFVNGNSPIIQEDIRLHNGFIHVLGKVLTPSKVKIGEKFCEDLNFSIYAAALAKTGYEDIMDNTPAEDASFNPNADHLAFMTHTVLEEYPTARKIGFTILAVSDADLANYTECPACPNGVHSLADLEKVATYYYSQVYSDGEGVTNYTDKRNYLNRFMAYQCLDRTLLSSRFIKDYDMPNQFKTYDMFEYIETMLSNTLLEVQLKRGCALENAEFGLLNCMGDPNKGARFTSYKDKPDGGALNGYYQGITKPLIYSKQFIGDISSKRLRMDGACFFPELATNNMRGNNPTGVAATVGKTHAYLIPRGYLAGMTSSENTRFTYIGACVAYEDFEGDELYLKGTYNFTITTPPIPAGTYEIRMGYQPTAYRGIAQLYWDSVPCGIPLNLSLYATDPEIGYVTPGSDRDDPYGYENDKMMHNRGYMKGPSSYFCFGHWYGYNAATARLSSQSLRRVLGTYTFSEAKKHTFTVVSLGSTSGGTQFMMDYLEFTPTELLETENIE
ncbi:MAG: fasciclin domain-containing protein [Bacteroidota bacterium]|nr:fasciclin domain-containing protein [Bacteroidota bacterium]